ncbi:MAG TPA: hypothetical protein VLC72_00735 [Nitrosopumilaceae archaeon]|nr:hypothetical protein [Nitrosopumilaceae archaeon]
MIALKRSYIVLLIGVGTLVAGSIVFGVNSSVLATDFLTNNLVIKQATIAPGSEYKTEMTLQNGESVTVMMRGQPYENKAQASIMDKNGAVVWKETFNGDHISNFNAKQGQTYQIVIKNIDKTNVSVDAIVGNVPFMGLDNNSNTGNVAGTLAGLGVGIIGIIILIVGGVLFFVDRKSKTIVAQH